jgi:uncharacterized Zn-binding protein involved in type VI secretion
MMETLKTLEEYEAEAAEFIRKRDEEWAKKKLLSTHAIATLGSKTDNGGEVITATSGAVIDGHRVARVGDKVMDPVHGETVIVSGAGFAVMDDGVPVAIVGSETSSGARIVSSLQSGRVIAVYEGEPIPGLFEKGYEPPHQTNM